MEIENKNTPAKTGIDNHLSAEGIDTTTGQSAEAGDETNPTSGEATSSSTDEETPETGISWDLALTADSTALNVITNIIVEDEGDLLGNPGKLDEVKAFLNGETKFDSNTEKLQAGRELTREFLAQQNLAMSGVVGTFSGYAIQTGRLLIALKALAKNCGYRWEAWTADNIKFIAPRTRQANMQLASVPGIEKHLYLGKERLILLANATNGADGDDPIGDFLGKHNLAFNPAR